MHPTKYYPFEAAPFIESPKIAEVFKEAEIWGEIMDIGYVCNLNALIEADAHKELIQIAEALHEKKVATIADIITKQRKRVILIAGPSSSGKTTFANRLKVQLKVNGLHPITISTDNYFVDRELTPKDENGDLDFESLDAVDVDLFNTHIMKLLDGESVNLPIFDFHKGKRTYRQQPICITANQPIIIEGIHGLNEKLSYHIFKRDKFKIYVSALTQLNIDEHNRIPTTQTRLLRRIVRDNQFRGHSALKTINMWNSVRRGEEKNIFPFQEEADIMFNTALPYELAILKKHAEPLLKQIPQSEPAYGEALLLMKFLSYFVSIDDDQLVPHVSILKEFIGGSGFDV
jgi:uridine kinase